MTHVSTKTSRIRRCLKLAVARQARGRRLRNELDATSDRGLAEMGIARGDINAVAFRRAARL